MSNEFQNLNTTQSFNKELNPKIHQVTFQDLIRFKEELLKDLRNYKTKISSNINSEFEKFTNLIEKSNLNLENYEKDKCTFMSKIEFTQEKENLFFELANKNTELKNQVMINQVHISSCRKDIDDNSYKYDKIISDNLLVPGLIGKSCKFQNLKEYILSNKEEINNALFANRQASNDINVLKKKTETMIGQFNTKLKSLEYRMTNFINAKYNEIVHKFEVINEDLLKKMANLTRDINSNIEERNNELARMKNFVFEENSKALENFKSIREEIKNDFNAKEKSFKLIKKNILNLTNLLMGRTFNQNKQLVITNFNNMMLELFKEYNLGNTLDKWNNYVEPGKSRMSLQTSVVSPAPINRKSTMIKTNANSFIKQYIEGKISSDETKFNHETSLLKRKKSFQLNDKHLTSGNNDIVLNKSNNINIISNNINNNNELFKSLNLRLSKIENANSDMLEKYKKAFSDNKLDIKNDPNKDNNQLKFEPIKKKFIKKNTTILTNYPSNINNEIINEEDSNKDFSSNSNNNSKEVQKRNDNNKKRSSKSSNKFMKKKTFNLTENKKKEEEKKSEKDYDFKKMIDFSDSSTSSKKLDNTIENTKQNNNNIKTENTNTINSNNNNNSSSQKKTSSKTKKSNEFKIIKNYSYNVNNNNNNTDKQNIKNQSHNKKAEEEDNNNKKNTNNNEDKKKEFKELKIEKIFNFYIENKVKIKQISDISFNIKSNISNNNLKIKTENTEKFSFINNNNEESKKGEYKKNADLQGIKEKINKTENILYSYNNSKKIQKEGIQMPPNKIKNNPPRKTSPIIIKSRLIQDSNKNINISNNNDNNIASPTSSNYVSKTAFSTKKDLLEKTRNKNILNIEGNEENNTEKNKRITLNDKEKNKMIKQKIKSAQKMNKKKLVINNTNISKDDKEIYVSKDILTSTRYIKDEDIIDKPLLFDMNVFKVDKSKGSLENRVAELEFFTKKKLDELVKEIKIFIPIHFNSHIRNYSVDKNK